MEEKHQQAEGPAGDEALEYCHGCAGHCPMNALSCEGGRQMAREARFWEALSRLGGNTTAEQIEALEAACRAACPSPGEVQHRRTEDMGNGRE